MKIPSTRYATHDLLVHLGHELEVVRAQRAGDPHLRRGPVPALAAVGVDGDPVGMRVVDILVGRVRIGARHHDHAQLAAARHQLAEGVAVAQPRAAVMQRDLGGIVGHAAAGAQAGGIGMGAPEIIQPESEVVLAGVVFDQRQLRPAHGPVNPARVRRRARSANPAETSPTQCDRRPRHAAGLQERSPRDVVLHGLKDSTPPEGVGLNWSTAHRAGN